MHIVSPPYLANQPRVTGVRGPLDRRCLAAPPSPPGGCSAPPQDLDRPLHLPRCWTGWHLGSCSFELTWLGFQPCSYVRSDTTLPTCSCLGAWLPCSHPSTSRRGYSYTICHVGNPSCSFGTCIPEQRAPLSRVGLLARICSRLIAPLVLRPICGSGSAEGRRTDTVVRIDFSIKTTVPAVNDYAGVTRATLDDRIPSSWVIRVQAWTRRSRAERPSSTHGFSGSGSTTGFSGRTCPWVQAEGLVVMQTSR